MHRDTVNNVPVDKCDMYGDNIDTQFVLIDVLENLLLHSFLFNGACVVNGQGCAT